MADSTINIFGNSGEAMVGADTINTILASMDSKLTSDDINIETLGDGTVDVDVKNDTYTINLNHTHENMAKLVVDTAANLPDASEMESDTIYGELDDGEIATIYLGGYPFYGGGGSSSVPVLRRPTDGATIDMGQTTSGTVNKTINVKGKNLTQALTIELDGTGYSFGSTQPSGVTRDSSTQLTVTTAAANALNGVDIVVVYTGSDTDEDAEGTLGITSASPDSISTEATLIANKVTYEDLAGVKLTGTQWLQTDYYPNTNTEFDLVCKFEKNSNTEVSGHEGKYFLYCERNSNTKYFAFMTSGVENGVRAAYAFLIRTEDFSPFAYYEWGSEASFCKKGTLHYKNGQSAGEVTFLGASVTNVPRKTTAQSAPLYIGVSHLPSGTVIYDLFNLTIYELTIKENGVILKHYVPKMRNGVPGLYDTVNDTFIHSGSSTELEIVQ